MILTEWGSLPADVLVPLYRREEAVWRSALGWDTAASWATVEAARVGWGLPGLVCTAATGAIRGWTFYMRRDDRAEIGGLAADSDEATAMLLDGVLARSASLGGFIHATAPGLQAACAARAIAVERYAYLTRSVNRVPYEKPAFALRPWRTEHFDVSAALLKSAYGDEGRLFAGDGSEEEWRAYLHNLLAYSGCGTLRPDLSRVVESQGRVAGLALLTALAPETAHLAQLAVDPCLRRTGVARALVAEALRAAHGAGFTRLSLLVSRGNVPAGRLYRQWGFAESGEFAALRT